MSMKLRIKYAYRSLAQRILSVRLPAVLTGLQARLFVLSFVIVGTVGYMAMTNNLATSGYQVHDLENQVAGLQQDVEKLNIQVASNQSMASIQKRLPNVAMAPETNVAYIKAPSDVAMANR